MGTRRAQRRAYRVSRFLGDINAVQRGRYPQRVLKRAYHRQAIRALKTLKLW